jgi:hypothetical protein
LRNGRKGATKKRENAELKKKAYSRLAMPKTGWSMLSTNLLRRK